MSTLLRDFYSFGEIKIISEGRKGSGPMKIKGLFQEAERCNGNKRIYPKSTLTREVHKLQEIISEKRLIGELDHPTDEIVHLNNASHVITGLYMEGNQVIGEAEILNTPAGKILQELLGAGVKVGISSRGTGTLTPNVSEGTYTVGENLRMITWDMVSDPSCPGAFPSLTEHQTISEGRDTIVNELDGIRAERIFITALKKSLSKK